jgi:helicase
MKMGDLIRYGIPVELIRSWTSYESETLLPLQEIAVKRHGLFSGSSLVIQAPTSSGKTFIGEMAAVRAALDRQKALYLVPLKALAEEKYHDFTQKYGAYGIKVIVSSRDFREFDGDLQRGDFSIGIVVYEKLAQLFARRPERLEEVNLVIIDELEMLADEKRGQTLELLLAQILMREERLQLIGLSAVLADGEDIAEWLGAKFLAWHRRPVELRQGVLYNGRFRYRTYNDREEGYEKLAQSDDGTSWGHLCASLVALAERDEQSLVFVKGRAESRRGACDLAESLPCVPAQTAIEELDAMEHTQSKQLLIECLEHGVAFHNADLSALERRVVERYFKRGEITVIVATSTLAMGMNLPAKNVFIEPDRWKYDDRFGTPWISSISQAEYENMAGRAGRLALEEEFGRAILVAGTAYEREVLWRRYVEGECKALEPQLANGKLGNHLLRLVASGIASTGDEAAAILRSTLTGRRVWTKRVGEEEFRRNVHVAIEDLVRADAVEVDGRGGLSVSAFGRAATACGISIETGRALKEWVEKSQDRYWEEIDLILALATTRDGRTPYVSMSSHEYACAGYVERLRDERRSSDWMVDTPLNRLLNASAPPLFDEMKAIKVALVLKRWIDLVPVHEIEEEFSTMAGQIVGAAEQMSWLADAAIEIAKACGHAERLTDTIRDLSDRLRFGVTVDGLALARLRVDGLDRSAIAGLAAAGCVTPESIVHSSVEKLASVVGQRIARALKERFPKESVGVTQSANGPFHLVIDDRRPGVVVIGDTQVRLPERPYRLIRLLAERPQECVTYDEIYAALWGADVFVENNQMHQHKSEILRRTRDVMPEDFELIRTIPKRGFVLTVPPEMVRVIRIAPSEVSTGSAS